MAGGALPGISALSWLFLAAAILFQFFVILSGAVTGSPEQHFYYLAADTSNLGSAPSMTAWSFFSWCDVTAISTNANTFNCRSVSAAPPFDPPRNFGYNGNGPADFLGTKYYYYLSRTTWAFYIIALFFAFLTLVSSIAAFCSRLFALVTGVLAGAALFFQILASSLLTAFVVKGRDAFRADNRAASIGAYMMGFTWATVAALFLSMLLYCVGGAVGKGRKYNTKKSRWDSFGRKRSTRSRGSFRAGDGAASTSDANGVKEEYA